jgi:hypothetical protein
MPSISPEKWIDLLKLYGPMALFVFMVFVLWHRASVTEGLSANQKKTQNVAFKLVWLSIFLLAGMIVVAWWRTNFPGEFVISGTIRHLRYPEIVTTEEQFYLHRHTVAGLDFQYDWRFISPTQYAGPVELLLQKKLDDSETLRYELPMRKDFYHGTVDLDYNRQNGQMILSHDSQKEVVTPVLETVPGEGSRAINRVSPRAAPLIVRADSPLQAPVEDILKALDADDPLLRQRARRDLIALGPAAVPSMEKSLTDPSSSTRLKAGVMSALRDMNPQSKELLHEPARCAIAKAVEAEGALRTEASALIASGVTIPSACKPAPASPSDKAGCMTEKISVHELQLFHTAKSDLVRSADGSVTIVLSEMVPVYVARQSQGKPVFGRLSRPPNSADIIIITTPDWMPIAEKAGWKIARVKRGYLKQDVGFKVKTDVLRAALATAGPQAYVESKMADGDVIAINVKDKRYTVSVKTHFISEYAEVTLCPSL